MDDFLYILKLQLEGRLSDEQITDQMHIYEDYIQEQLAEELRNLGAWITVNADAVLGLEGMGPKKYCKKMLKAECVDAIASDSHGIKNRANHMGKCYELIEKKFGREYADQLLVNHPAKILTGEMK